MFNGLIVIKINVLVVLDLDNSLLIEYFGFFFRDLFIFFLIVSFVVVIGILIFICLVYYCYFL